MSCEIIRDHKYQSRMKNCHARFKLTVENEKSLCEKKAVFGNDYGGWRQLCYHGMVAKLKIQSSGQENYWLRFEA